MLRGDCPKLRDVLDGLREPIMVIDTEYNVRLANQAMMDLDPDSLRRPVRCYEISHRRTEPCSGEAHPCPLARVTETGRTMTVTHEHTRDDGDVAFVEIVASPLWNDEGEFLGIVESGRDITERVRAQQALEQALRDKELLMREMHHRVKNNLLVIQSLLQLQSRQLDDAEARRYFDESQHRVRSMGMIHERLYRSQDFSRVEFDGYVRNLVEQLLASYRVGLDDVEMVVDIPPIYLDVDTIIPCGLILNELISNALEHAFPDDREGRLEVSLREIEPGRYELRVADDGVGLPGDLDVHAIGSLGLKIVTSLARQLGGSLDIDRGEGTEFRITFTDPEARDPARPEASQAPSRRAG
ncbi:MAG: histidine kinase dimerization/phosphoacceptor domain -containing protein [Myxococcota bacterium]